MSATCLCHRTRYGADGKERPSAGGNHPSAARRAVAVRYPFEFSCRRFRSISARDHSFGHRHRREHWTCRNQTTRRYGLGPKPEEAGYDGMPRSAVATNLADKVLTVREMPEEIAEFARNLPEPPTSQADGETGIKAAAPSSTLLDIINVLRAKTAHDFTSYKPGTLQRRVERRMGMKGLSPNAMDQYLALIDEERASATTWPRIC